MWAGVNADRGWCFGVAGSLGAAYLSLRRRWVVVKSLAARVGGERKIHGSGSHRENAMMGGELKESCNHSTRENAPARLPVVVAESLRSVARSTTRCQLATKDEFQGSKKPTGSTIYMCNHQILYQYTSEGNRRLSCGILPKDQPTI